MNEVAYIIPGYPHSGREKPYRRIAGFFKSRRIKPILANIRWKYTALSDNLDEFMRKQQKFGGDEIYLLGFSIGAVIAFIASTKIKTKMAILCSLSPVFKEDLPYLKRQWKRLMGKRRINDLKKYSFNSVARIVNNSRYKIILVAGSKEYKELLKRVKTAKKKLKHAKLVISRATEHDISQKEYLETLRKIISKI